MAFQVGAFQPAYQQVLEQVGQTPAGKAAKRRYYVEIDGHSFPVASAEEAQQFLQRARAIAERQAEDRAEKATKAIKRKPSKVEIQKPKITASSEIRAEVAPLIQDIERLYTQAQQIAELRILLALQEEQDEEDVFILLN